MSYTQKFRVKYRLMQSGSSKHDRDLGEFFYDFDSKKIRFFLSDEMTEMPDYFCKSFRSNIKEMLANFDPKFPVSWNMETCIEIYPVNYLDMYP